MCGLADTLQMLQANFAALEEALGNLSAEGETCMPQADDTDIMIPTRAHAATSCRQTGLCGCAECSR